MWSGVLKNSATSKIYKYRVISRTQVQNGTTTKLIKNFIKLYLNESLMNKKSKQQESIDFDIIKIKTLHEGRTGISDHGLENALF